MTTIEKNTNMLDLDSEKFSQYEEKSNSFDTKSNRGINLVLKSILDLPNLNKNVIFSTNSKFNGE